MNKKILMTIVLLASQILNAQVESYKIPVVRDGVQSERLVYNFWSGEYPGPVIDVTEPMTIDAYASVRTLNEVKKCTIEKGVYHPWSKTQNSIDTYYSIVEISSFKAVKNTIIKEVYSDDNDGKALKVLKGEKVVNVIYLSEGWCEATLLSTKGKKTPIQYLCQEVDSNQNFKSISQPNDAFFEQWMYLNCAEGYSAFVQDEAFLAMPNVKEGQILGYGDVGPAEEN